METRLGVSGNTIRIEKAKHVEKAGTSPLGCTVPKWVRHTKYLAIHKLIISVSLIQFVGIYSLSLETVLAEKRLK